MYNSYGTGCPDSQGFPRVESLNGPSAAGDFDCQEVANQISVDTQKPKPKRLFAIAFEDLELDLTQPALIDGLLDQGAMSVVYGDSNAGKTFWVLDLSLHIALGREWNGRPVEPGGVVYVAAEGSGSLKKRVAAFRRFYELNGTAVPFWLVPCSVDLLDPNADTGPLIDLIREKAEQAGLPVRLLVIDTLARALAGGNENAPNDMGGFVSNVDRIRDATDAHTLIIHHCGKDRAKGARGHSSLRAATDTEIEVSASAGKRLARVCKQRDLETGARFGFALRSVEIASNAKGEAVTSAVVVPTGAAPESKTMSPQVQKAFDALRELGAEDQSVPLADWRAECDTRQLSKGDAEAQRKAFTRAREKLATEGLIEERDGAVSIIRTSGT